MTEAFEREERYIVVKIRDFHTESDLAALRDWLEKFKVPTRECVVVEADWGIYEETWANVEREAQGRPSIGQERDAALGDIEALGRHSAEMEVERNKWAGKHDALAAHLRVIDNRARNLLNDYESAISAMEYEDEAAESRTIANNLREALDAVPSEAAARVKAQWQADLLNGLLTNHTEFRLPEAGPIVELMTKIEHALQRQAQGADE